MESFGISNLDINHINQSEERRTKEMKYGDN